MPEKRQHVKTRNPKLWELMLRYGFSEKMLGNVIDCAESIATQPVTALPIWVRRPRKPKVNQKPPAVLFCESDAWLELRDLAIEKYGSVCMCCGSVSRIQVDHVKPKSRYPDLALDINNLQILCWPCNRTKANRHETDYRESHRTRR